MQCTCDVDHSDYDGPAFLTERRYRARKQYRCCECRRDIKPKDQYWRATGCWDGRFSSYKTCGGCMTLRKAYTPRVFIYGGLREALWDCLGLDYVTNVTIDDKATS